LDVVAAAAAVHVVALVAAVAAVHVVVVALAVELREAAVALTISVVVKWRPDAPTQVDLLMRAKRGYGLRAVVNVPISAAAGLVTSTRVGQDREPALRAHLTLRQIATTHPARTI
jgi:hypothetical protein